MAATQAAADCGRYRDHDLQPCEFRRDARADVLDAAHRPPAARLGAEAIRFSTRPALGGSALVIEIVRRNRGHADVRVFSFTGHPRFGWEPDDRNLFVLPAAAYRQLAGQVDAALADYRPPVVGPNGEMIVCTDGPGSLTERVRDRAITTLTGSCPPTATALHPNRVIAAAIQDLLCRRLRQAARRTYWSGRRCFEQLETIAEWQARGGEQ